MTEKQKLITASGDPISSQQDTHRQIAREQENTKYIPVIVKRTDETFRHPDDILEKAIEEGMEQLARPVFSLFLSAGAAGMILCFTVLSVAVMAGLVTDQHPFARVLIASVYPLGFVLCILSRTQLFTEHTATAVYPVLDAKSKPKELFRLWGIVILGNLLGGTLAAFLLMLAEDVIGASEGYYIIASHLLDYPPKVLLISTMLAGWLMALGAWIVLSTSSTISQMLSIYLVTFIIGLGGLHHSIAGYVELVVGYLTSDSIEFRDLPPVVLTVLGGNLVGGSVFVAMLNYGHIRHSQRKE